MNINKLINGLKLKRLILSETRETFYMNKLSGKKMVQLGLMKDGLPGLKVTNLLSKVSRIIVP